LSPLSRKSIPSPPRVTFAFKNLGGKAAKLVVTFKKTGTYR
jgi:hypothetical protein